MGCGGTESGDTDSSSSSPEGTCDGKKHDDYFLPKGDYPLEFERQVSPWDQNLWRVCGNTYKYVHPKKRVDKKRKAEIKPYMAIFQKAQKVHEGICCTYKVTVILT